MRRTQDNYNISGVCRMTQCPIQPYKGLRPWTAVAQNRRPQRKSFIYLVGALSSSLDTKVKQIFFTDISFSLSLITMLCLTVQFLNPSSQFFATLKLTKTDWENIFQKKTSIMTNAAVEPAGGCSIQLMLNSIFTFLQPRATFISPIYSSLISFEKNGFNLTSSLRRNNTHKNM